MTGSIRKVPGAGGKPNHGIGVKRRFGIHFDTDTIDEVRQRAIKSEISFAECIRELVEIGLETEKLDNEGLPS